MNTIVNMFPSKVREDNDSSVHYIIECKIAVGETVKLLNPQVVSNYNFVDL